MSWTCETELMNCTSGVMCNWWMMVDMNVKLLSNFHSQITAYNTKLQQLWAIDMRRREKINNDSSSKWIWIFFVYSKKWAVLQCTEKTKPVLHNNLYLFHMRCLYLQSLSTWEYNFQKTLHSFCFNMYSNTVQ